MPNIKLVDFQGNPAGEHAVSDAVFGITPNAHVMHLHVVRQLSNGRAGTHSTLTRSEVSGGGRKPWKQKGTGRARAGSTRSPLWRGGGVIFGPKPNRNYVKEMPRKMRRLALRSALSSRLDAMIAVKDMALETPSTKKFAAFLKQVGATGKVLLILDQLDDNIVLSARNIEGLRFALASNLSVKDLLNHDKIVVTPAAIQRIEEVFAS